MLRREKSLALFLLWGIALPVLANPKNERFAQELAKGKTADEAYVLAGYKENRGNAATLKAKQSILKRVQEIQGRAAEKAGVTRERILDALARIAFAPVGSDHIKTADIRAACMDLAKIEGHVVDRAEVGGPGDFDRMDDEELARHVASEAAELGIAGGRRH